MSVSPRELIGTLGEVPTVVMAIGTQTVGIRLQTIYRLVVYIRHPDPKKRTAMTSSERAMCFACKEMDDALAGLGIAWNGSYVIMGRDQLKALAGSLEGVAENGTLDILE